MDHVRKRMKEYNKSRQLKIVVGLIAFVAVVVCAILVERSISMQIKDFTVKKSEISEEKAVFIPLKPLKTNIIAVKTGDNDYRLAFDECQRCYLQYGKKSGFKNNENNTGLICKNCKGEVRYEQMGFGEDTMPYPIYINEIIENEDNFILTKEYLESHKQIFKDFKNGTLGNPYSPNNTK